MTLWQDSFPFCIILMQLWQQRHLPKMFNYKVYTYKNDEISPVMETGTFKEKPFVNWKMVIQFKIISIMIKSQMCGFFIKIDSAKVWLYTHLWSYSSEIAQMVM